MIRVTGLRGLVRSDFTLLNSFRFSSNDSSYSIFLFSLLLDQKKLGMKFFAFSQLLSFAFLRNCVKWELFGCIVDLLSKAL
jgi:hypothetical protein